MHTYMLTVCYLYFSTLMTVFIAGGLGKMAGHSMIKYMKAKAALKTTFALLNRVPAIDVASVKGIVLVRMLN